MVKITYKGETRNVPRSYLAGLKGKERREQIKSFFEETERPETSFKSKRSGWVKKFEDKYGTKISDKKFIHKNIITYEGQRQIINKGKGAYYSSGSRPNRSIISTCSCWRISAFSALAMRLYIMSRL